MSRRSIAHSVRTVIEVSNQSNTRHWTIAAHTPQTREDRDPSWDRNNPTSRAEQWKKKQQQQS